MKHPVPMVDIIIEKNGRIVLVKRKEEPFKEKWAIPGGHIKYGEKVEEAAIREAFEETSLKVKLNEVIGIYSDPNRDPRYPTLSIVFHAECLEGKLKASSDALEARWFYQNEIDFENLAFDHSKILRDYIKWKKEKGTFWSGK